MKILYVTVMWTALAEVLLEGTDVCKGMPAFFRPLRRLVEDGHEVTMLIVEKDPAQHARPLQPKIGWMKQIRYRRCLQRFTACGLRKPLSEASAVWTNYRAAREILKEGGYDLVYGHGPDSEGAGVAAARLGIPFGLRRYGDGYYSYIKQFSLFRAICSRPSNYWSYRRPKAFTLATNDSSQIDKVYHLLNGKKEPYPLYFWRNGYEPVPEGLMKNTKIPEDPYLLYVARFVREKCQDRGVRLLYEAKNQGVLLQLYLAGQQDDPVFFQEVMELAEALGVAQQVHYLGSISLPEIAAYSRHAAACLALADYSNFGNVFIEYITNGGIVLSTDNGSLDEVVRSGENGFLVRSMTEAARVVLRLLREPGLSARVRKNAEETSRAYFLTWEERVAREIALIEETALPGGR